MNSRGPDTPGQKETKLPGWQRRGLSPTRGLVAFALLLAVLLNFHFFWETFSHLVIILLEVAEEIMDILLEHLGLGSGAAQMITAYTGFGLFVILLIFVFRKLPAWLAGFRTLMRDYREMYVHVLRILWATGRLEMAAWWASLDWLGKIAATVGILVFVIPLFIALSYGLGLLVSMLFI
jgi:hypothetical protein